MLKKIFIFILLIISESCLAQDKLLDSLYDALSLQKTDTNKVNTLGRISRRLRKTGQDEKALETATRALELAQKLNFKRGIERSYRNIGQVHLKHSDYKKGIEAFEKALKIALEEKDKSGYTECYYNLGMMYYGSANYPKALEYDLISLKYDEESGDKHNISDSYLNIGTVYDDMRNYEKAIEYYVKAMQIKKEIKDSAGYSTCYMNLGNTYNTLHNFEKALEAHNRGLEIRQLMGRKPLISQALMNRGNVYSKMLKYDLALKDYLNALDLDNGNNLNTLSDIYLNIANCYRNLKQAAKAGPYLSKGLKLKLRIGDRSGIASSYEGLALFYKETGNYKLAFDYYVKFKEATDSIFNLENSKQLSDLKTDFEVEKKEAEMNAASKAEKEKIQAVAAIEKRKQQIIIYSICSGLLLLGVILVIIFRSLQQNKKANKIIMQQKVTLEEHQKEIIASIHYAKRIQNSLMSPEKFISKTLNRLQKKDRNS